MRVTSAKGTGEDGAPALTAGSIQTRAKRTRPREAKRRERSKATCENSCGWRILRIMTRLLGTPFNVAFVALTSFMVYRVCIAVVALHGRAKGGIIIGMWFLALLGLMANGLR